MGCHAYTGEVKTELVKNERVDVEVVRDDLVVSVLQAPSPAHPYIKVRVHWDYRKEYRVQKTFRVLREYYPYEGSREVLEMVSSPFLFLLSLPVGLVMAPFEFIYAEVDQEHDTFLSWQMIKLPFLCINPAGNADEWAAKKNIYGKKTLFENTGVPKIEKGAIQAETFRRSAAKARVTVVLPEINKSFTVRTDRTGAAVFRITEALARISMDGKGLGIKMKITYGKKRATREFTVDPGTLMEIYESLVMG